MNLINEAESDKAVTSSVQGGDAALNLLVNRTTLGLEDALGSYNDLTREVKRLAEILSGKSDQREKPFSLNRTPTLKT